ncbi:Probable magnesium transporter NIPA7 [Durusdinium trenchii]|uniref:Probable magnesium transporter NIPA7 n=1 Tax=Durusdinium trenchii TaxID=1381693 RepID=A0ABP0HI98_9DINO
MGKTSKKASAAKAVRKAPKRRVQGKTGRSQHAFACFSKEARKDVLAKVHLSDPKNLGAASKALAAAWAELSTQERKPYEASAMLARGQKQLEQLRGSKLKDPVQLQQASKALRAAVEALAESRDVTKAIGLVEALESLDSRLSNPQRSTLALPNWRAAVQGAGAAMGAEVGGRLSALLRKWAEAPQVGRTRTTKKTEVLPKSAARSAGSALDESMRSKFVGILMRIVARTGKACFDACSRVERALFEKCGKDPKEYRQRARSLSHNLGSSDGKLLRQVLEGVLPPWRLVALEAEDLAPEALKAAREEERERYFRSEAGESGPMRSRDGIRSKATHMTHVLQRVPLWLWGVCLCVLSNCLTALGLVTQKMAHIQNEQSGKKANYLKQPWFIAGRDHGMTHQKLDKEVVRLFEFYKEFKLARPVTGYSAANIPAMALAPQTMLSCLGGLSLVFNSTYAHLLLGEHLRYSEMLVMCAMVLGAVLVVSVTPVPKERKVYANQIFHSILHPAFLWTALGVVCVLVTLRIACKWFPQLKIIFLGLTCAATGSYSMTFFKCGAEVVGRTSRWWLNLELYALAVVALGIVTIQITSMNQGLRHGDVVIVIPTFFALGVLFSLVQAQLAFGELNDLSGAPNVVLFATGVALVIGSTVALLLLHSDAEAEGLPPIDEEEYLDMEEQRAPLLEDRRTSSEPSLKRNHWSITSLSPLGMPCHGSFDDIHELTLISVTGPMGVA